MALRLPCALAGAASSALLAPGKTSPVEELRSSPFLTPRPSRLRALFCRSHFQGCKNSRGKRWLRVRSGGGDDDGHGRDDDELNLSRGEKESEDASGEDEGGASHSGRVEVEVSPAVMKQLEAATRSQKKNKDGENGLTMAGVMEILEEVVKSGGGGETSSSGSGLSLIEQNLKKRRERFGGGQGELEGENSKPDSKAAVPLSFDVDARNDENRFDGAYFARLEELGEETLEINTLDDFYPAFIILITDAMLELGDLMKMLGDGEFFSTQAMLRGGRLPNGKSETSSGLKEFPDDVQLRRSLENILVYVQALSFYISSLFAGPDGISLNVDESLATEADLLYNMYYKYKHKETVSVPLDEAELLENVVIGHGFDPKLQKAVKCRQGLIFRGNWTFTPAVGRLSMQKILDEKYNGLVAILLDRVPGTEDNGVIIAHRNELLSFTLAEKGDIVLASSLLFGVTVCALQFSSADVGYDQVNVQAALVPLGLLAVTAAGWAARKAVAALYKVSHMVRLPFSLPVPHQGSFSTVVFYKGCLPNRTTLLDLSLSSTLASLAISTALIFASSQPLNLESTSVADFEGLLLVPEHLFQYSTAFSWLIHKLSIATLSGEPGKDLHLVLNPVALAGVLGLHSTALGLLPVGIFDGGRIVTGIFGRDVQHVVTTVAFFLVAVSLVVNEPWLALAWVVGTTPALMDDWFQIDEATQPGFLRKAVGLALVVAAVGAFVPTLVT